MGPAARIGSFDALLDDPRSDASDDVFLAIDPGTVYPAVDNEKCQTLNGTIVFSRKTSNLR